MSDRQIHLKSNAMSDSIVGLQELSSYLKYLFELIVAPWPILSVWVRSIIKSLILYDLFHAHMFLATETGRY